MTRFHAAYAKGRYLNRLPDYVSEADENAYRDLVWDDREQEQKAANEVRKRQWRERVRWVS
jgi:hypothetical protein